MLDVSLFRRPAFVGVQAGTFAIGAGMFALFPFLSIYLQDILGYSPLGAGLRFLPITVFVFFVPIATRKVGGARADVGAALGEPRDRRARRAADGGASRRTRAGSRCFRASSSPGSASGSRTRRSRPRRFASSIRRGREWRRASATPAGSRGLAMGVAVLGAVLQVRVEHHLTAAGYPGKELASAVSSSGLRAAGGNDALANVATAAFVSGLRLVFLIGFAVVLLGSIAAAVLVRRRSEAPEAVPEPAR